MLILGCLVLLTVTARCSAAPADTGSCSRSDAEVTNGRLGKSEYNYLSGEKVDFTCNENYYTPDGKRGGERECLPHGRFTDAKCSRYCKMNQLNNGKYEPKNEVFEIGQFLQITCNNGFKTRRNTLTENIQCLRDGWQITPDCIEVTCFVTSGLNSGKREYKAGEVAQFSCPNNYIFDGEKSSQCYYYGWGPQLPTCKAVRCRVQDNLLISDRKEYGAGEDVRFSCGKGYRLVGESNVRCNNNGWSPAQPHCEVDRCVVQDVRLNPQRKEYGLNERVQFSCPRGYTLKGQRFVQCRSNGWSPNLPTCEGAEPEGEAAQFCIIQDPQLILSPHFEKYEFTKSVEFSCPDNFVRVGASESTCTKQDWKPELPTCEAANPDQPEPTDKPNSRQKCPPASAPPGFQIITLKNDYYNGEKVEILCSPGSVLRGDREIRCVDGRWEFSAQCIQKQRCGNPRGIENGEITEDTLKAEYVTGDIVKYSCNPGYSLRGSNENKCTGGTWLAPPHCAANPCGAPPGVDNGRVIGTNTNYIHGESAKYTCNKGFKLTEESPAKCLKGDWTNVPECVSTSCPPPPSIDNGRLIPNPKAEYASGDKVQYTCNKGYNLEKTKSEATCEETKWKSVPVCRMNLCVVEDVLLNPLKKEYGLNERVEFSCPRGCTLKGESIVYCRSNGWSPKLPSCEVTFCTSQNPPLILRPLLDEYHFGKSVELSCPVSFTKIGANDSTCTKNGWNPELPTCEEPKTVCSKPPNVQFGDHLGPNQPHYRSGFQLEYKCPNYFTLVGNTIVTCKDGVWDEPPVCLEPCTVQEKHLRENNIAFRWTDAKKIYLQHDEFTESICIEGYEIADISLLRLKCNKGVIPYPKCNKIGSCLLSKETMKKQDIFLNRNTAIQDGESVLFECNKGMKPENTVEATCRMRVLTYPKCIPAMPCRISLEELDAMNVRLKSQDDVNKVIQDGEEVDIECKAGSESPVAGI